jgi:putative ABC transport system substrate-binding protein
LRRRDFVALLGATAVQWPLQLRARQGGMPVIGLLSSLTANERPTVMAGFLPGIAEAGFTEGGNVAIEYRWAEGQYDRLPALAAELVNLDVSVIAAITGTPTGLAAKAATATIPIVFAMGSDPVTSNLVGNLNRPGGNVTGVTYFTAVLGAKRIELLDQLVPSATTIAVLVNPKNPPNVVEGENALTAAVAMGRQPLLLNASTSAQIDEVFAGLAEQKISALYVSSDPLFFNQRNKVIALAASRGIPTIYADRELAEAGGLISYGASKTDAYRQAGAYVGRILRGEKAGELPVVLPSKFELVINLKTARALGLTVPANLFTQANAVIE